MALESRVTYSKTDKALRRQMFKYILLVSLTLLIATSLSCGGGEKYSIGETASDGIHSFKVLSATLLENVGDQVPMVLDDDGNIKDNYSFLVIECEIENVSGQQDDLRYWNEQITGDKLDLVYLNEQKQLGNVTLEPQQIEAGNITFTTKDNVRDFTLKFRFPVSDGVATYKFRADDLRLKAYVEHVLEKIEQRERVKNIPLIGGAVERFTRSSLKYYGEVLVPESDIPLLLTQLDDLNTEEREAYIEDYVRQKKGW